LGTLGALFPDQRIQGLNPLGSLFRITIRQLVSQPAEDMGGIFSCSHVQPLFARMNRRTQARQGDCPAYIRRVRRIGYNSPGMCAGQLPSAPMPARKSQGCRPAAIVVISHSSPDRCTMRSCGPGAAVVFRSSYWLCGKKPLPPGCRSGM